MQLPLNGMSMFYQDMYNTLPCSTTVSQQTELTHLGLLFKAKWRAGFEVKADLHLVRTVITKGRTISEHNPPILLPCFSC